MKNNNQTANGQDTNSQSDAQILQNLQSGGGNDTQSKGILPQIEVIEGVITKVKEITPKDGSNPFHIVRLGKDTEIIVNKTTMLRDKAILVFGNTVVATCERRISGKTGYEANGKWHLHKGQNGLSLKEVALTEQKAIADASVRDKVAEQALMHGAKVDAISAVMDNIKARIGDDPTALATAFAGAFSAIK